MTRASGAAIKAGTGGSVTWHKLKAMQCWGYTSREGA